MKNNQIIWLVGILVVLIAGSAYFFFSKASPAVEEMQEEKIEDADMNATSSAPVSTSTPASVPAPQPKSGVVMSPVKITEVKVDSNSFSPLVLSVTTDKAEYASDEEIIFRLRAYNPSDDSITLTFSGCNTFYSVLKFNSRNGMTCSTQKTQVIINPEEGFGWEFRHNPERYEIPEGVQKVVAGLTTDNKGVATVSTQIIIK